MAKAKAAQIMVGLAQNMTGERQKSQGKEVQDMTRQIQVGDHG